MESTVTSFEQHEANLKSPIVGVRWQAEMEDHLKGVREATRMTRNLGSSQDTDWRVRDHYVALANAEATAALALAVANTGSDLEVSMSKLVAGLDGIAATINNLR